MTTDVEMSPSNQARSPLCARRSMREGESNPDRFKAAFVPSTEHVVKTVLPDFYDEVTHTFLHGWLERALHSIVGAFVEETLNQSNSWRAMLFALWHKDLLAHVIGVLDSFTKAAHHCPDPLQFYTRGIYWFHSRLHSNKKMDTDFFHQTENVACELMRVFALMLHLVLSGPRRENQELTMYKLFTQPPPEHLRAGFPSSFYHPENARHHFARDILQEIDSLDKSSWQVEPWWRAAMDYRWFGPEVSLPHPPDKVSQHGTDACEDTENPFAVYFEQVTPYCKDLMFTSYIDYLERVSDILKNLLSRVSLWENRILGLCITLGTILGERMLEGLLGRN